MASLILVMFTLLLNMCISFNLSLQVRAEATILYTSSNILSILTIRITLPMFHVMYAGDTMDLNKLKIALHSIAYEFHTTAANK